MCVCAVCVPEHHQMLCGNRKMCATRYRYDNINSLSEPDINLSEKILWFAIKINMQMDTIEMARRFSSVLGPLAACFGLATTWPWGISAWMNVPCSTWLMVGPYGLPQNGHTVKWLCGRMFSVSFVINKKADLPPCQRTGKSNRLHWALKFSLFTFHILLQWKKTCSI